MQNNNNESSMSVSELAINAWLDRTVALLEKYAVDPLLGKDPRDPRPASLRLWIVRRILNPLRRDFGALTNLAQ